MSDLELINGLKELVDRLIREEQFEEAIVLLRSLDVVRRLREAKLGIKP